MYSRRGGTWSGALPVEDDAWLRNSTAIGMARIICAVCKGKTRGKVNGDMTRFNERRVGRWNNTDKEIGKQKDVRVILWDYGGTGMQVTS